MHVVKITTLTIILTLGFCFCTLVLASATPPVATTCEAMAAPKTQLTAAIIGATGSVGKEIVSHLCKRQEWGKVIVINRRQVEYSCPKVQQLVVEMDAAVKGQLEASCAKSLVGTDALFVTMGVGAPSKVSESDLKNVDVDLPTAATRGASAAGVRHVGVLTSAGAKVDPTLKPGGGGFLLPTTRAGGPLYSHFKGTVENNIGSFKFPSFSIFRPAALIGSSHTPGFLSVVSPVLDAILPTLYKSSDINTLAAAMVYDAENKLHALNADHDHDQKESQQIFEGKTLHDLYSGVPWATGKKCRSD